MKKTKITDQITYLEPDSMAKFSSCSGIIIESNKKIFIDINMGRDKSLEIIKKEQPDYAFITHYHLDHSIWIRQVKNLSNGKVFIPEVETKYLTSLDFVVKNTAQSFGLSEQWKKFIVSHLGFSTLENFSSFNKTTLFKELVPDINLDIIIVSTPGHSPGHTSFYMPEEKILFPGDMGLDRFGPWYGWKDCSIIDFIESILLLKGMDVNLILTSHGGVIQKNIDQAWTQSLDHFKQREQKILRELEAGQSRDTIIKNGLLYTNKSKIPDPMGSFLNMWDNAMYDHHESLLRQGGLVTFFPELFER